MVWTPLPSNYIRESTLRLGLGSENERRRAVAWKLSSSGLFEMKDPPTWCVMVQIKVLDGSRGELLNPLFEQRDIAGSLRIQKDNLLLLLLRTIATLPKAASR